MQEIEFLYDFGSPNAYLVHKTLPALAARHGAAIRPCPILLGGVFKATGNQSPMTAYAGVKGKLAHQAREIERFITRHGIKYHMNPYFPINTLLLMRAAIYAQGKAWENRYMDAVFDAIWVHGQDLGDLQVLAQVLDEAGLPRAEILEATRDDKVKQALIAATTAAVARGVYGAPTLFLAGEMFFGKDSLPELEYYLSTPAQE